MATEPFLSLPDPVLLGPRHEARVAADAVTLRWEPVEGAAGYRIEVARDTAFDDVVYEREAETADHHDVGGALPADHATYFWRVLAYRGDEWSPGEHVESFITLDASEGATSYQAQPDEREGFGPAAELFKAAGVEAAAEATGDGAGARSKAEELGVEHEGVESAQILGLAFGVMAALAVIIVLLFQWTTIVHERTSLEAAANPPGFEGSQAPRYPTLYETEAHAARALDNYTVLDDAQGRYRIPIDEAIKLMANEQAARADSLGAGAVPDLAGR